MTRVTFYDGMCSEEEAKFRKFHGCVSEFEAEGRLVAVHTRNVQSKASIRTPSGLATSIRHLLSLVGISSDISPENLNLFTDTKWKGLFPFVSDRFSSVKQEFVVGNYTEQHLDILLPIVKFYLFAMLDKSSDNYHRTISEAHSTLCLCINLIRQSTGELREQNREIIIFYFLFNIHDDLVIVEFLKSYNWLRHSVCMNLYKAYKSHNYHRFHAIISSLSILSQTCLSRHILDFRHHVSRVIFSGYKNQRLSYPFKKYLQYVFISRTDFKETCDRFSLKTTLNINFNHYSIDWCLSSANFKDTFLIKHAL